MHLTTPAPPHASDRRVRGRDPHRADRFGVELLCQNLHRIPLAGQPWLAIVKIGGKHCRDLPLRTRCRNIRFFNGNHGSGNIMQTERFELRLDRGMLEQLDQWRALQPDLPSRAEAVRRLVRVGLAESGEVQVSLSPGERLISLQLCDLAGDRPDTKPIDPNFVEEALFGNHLWALDMKHPGIFGVRPAYPKMVREVIDVLNLWTILEHGYENLGETDKARVKEEAKPYGAHVKFPGFYSNEESECVAIVRILIEHLERFTWFRQRELDSRRPVVDAYRRMLKVYEPMRQSLDGRDLSVSEIGQLLRELIHPDNRQN